MSSMRYWMKKGFAKPGSWSWAHAAVELGEHGLEDGVFFGVGAGGLGGGA